MKLFQLFFVIVISAAIMSCGSDKKNNINSSPSKSSSTKSSSEVIKMGQKTSVTADSNTSNGATPEQIKKAKELLKKTSQDDINSVKAKKVFKMHCSICHGFKGDMKVNGAKDLTKSNIPIEEAVAQVYHGKGLMTPYKGVLSDAEIIAVSHYALSLSK